MMAAAVLATSCVKELRDVAAGDATVTFTVGTPEIATRAYSDGTTATQLQYAVYDADGKLLNDLTVTDAEIHGSTTVSLTLTTGNTYSVIFWAAAPNAPYTVDFEHKTMTVDYTAAVSNDEARDAFFKRHTFTVTGAQTETIELKRPFAQLNIGTADYAKAASAGYAPTHSAVTVKNIYSTLNLEDGTVANDAVVTFGENVIPSSKVESFPVDGYEYLAMNYLLVSADKALVEVEFTASNENGANAKTRTVGSVPVQRNYRTNIYGNIFTSGVDFNVVIKPEYDEPAHESSALFNAAAFGGEVTLTEDVVLESTLLVQANMTINLNGKTISANMHKNEGAVIKNNANLTLIGGTVSSLADNGGSAVQNNGTMTINDVTLNGAPNANGSWPSYTVNNTGKLTIIDSDITSYHGAVASYGDGAIVYLNNTNIDMSGIPGFTSHGIYTYNNGKAVVNGGNIANKATDQNASGASVINGAVEVNSGDFSGRIENYYGTPVLKGGSFSVNPNKNFIAADMKAVEKDGRYYVVAEEIEAVAKTVTDLSEALANGKNVALFSDVNITKIDLTAVSNDIVIDANGNTITTASSYGVEVTAGKNITLKNAEVVITVDGNYINYSAGLKISNGDYAGKTIKLENCEIRMANTDWAYAVNMPASVKNLNLVIDNCVLEGAVALQCWGDNNTITVTNSKLICNYTTSAMYTSYCVALQGDGTNNSENNILTISNCEFSYSGVDNFNSTIKSVYDHRNTTTNTITVSDCTYVDVAAY